MNIMKTEFNDSSFLSTIQWGRFYVVVIQSHAFMSIMPFMWITNLFDQKLAALKTTKPERDVVIVCQI